MRGGVCIFGLTVLLGLMCGGCPEDLDVPPAQGEPCDADVDCNMGRACGPVAICVRGYCSSEGARVLPCPDAGIRIEGGMASATDAAR